MKGQKQDQKEDIHQLHRLIYGDFRKPGKFIQFDFFRLDPFISCNLFLHFIGSAIDRIPFYRLSKNAEAPARGKAKVDYLLAGKLFCGHCGGSMNGESGTSKTGAIHNYYTCYTRKRKHACDKKPLKKDWIEYIVAQDAMELLTDDTIQELADMAISQTEQDLRENTRIPELTDRMKETESGITNITKAIEKGIASDALMNRLVELEKEKKNLLRLLAEEEKYVCKIERSQIVYWLTEFKGGRIEDERYRRIIIDLMINSVTVWDEPDGFRITTAYNLTSCKSKTFRIAPSGEKGFGFEGSECTIVDKTCV